MRVSENQIYSAAIDNMNTSLDRLMMLNAQNASQKKLLRPSDNPAGMATSLDLHSHNGAIDHFLQNVKTAQGWLGLSDRILGEVSNTIIKIKELAQQAATDTYTYDQRMDTSKQIRELMNTLINQSNTRFADKSIFAGHKVHQNAFKLTMAATVLDASLNDSAVENVSGDATKVVRIEFTDSGTIGGSNALGYRYSDNAGKTWKTGTLAAGQRELTIGGNTVTLKNGIGVTAASGNTGTRINIRPSAQYLGDDADGNTIANLSRTQLTATTLGSFEGRVNVRIDNGGSLPGPVEYSFSLDGGNTWQTGNVSSNARIPLPGSPLASGSSGVAYASGARLTLPGGSLNLTSASGNVAFASGAQFSISPNSADISLSISRSQKVTVNSVGKDVFGGLYKKPGESLLTPAMSDNSKNLFETVGELIGFIETNDSSNIGKSLEKLASCHAHIGGVNGTMGARENLTGFVMNTLNLRKDTNTTYLANIESADAAKLMSEIKKSEFIYSSVVKTNQIILGINSMSVL